MRVFPVSGRTKNPFETFSHASGRYQNVFGCRSVLGVNTQNGYKLEARILIRFFLTRILSSKEVERF